MTYRKRRILSLFPRKKKSKLYKVIFSSLFNLVFQELFQELIFSQFSAIAQYLTLDRLPNTNQIVLYQVIHEFVN